LTNNDLLHGLASRLCISRTGGAFKIVTHAVETNPFLSIFFHGKNSSFDTTEHIAAFVGFCATSVAVTFFILALMTHADAEWACYHTAFTGCGGFVADVERQPLLANYYVAEINTCKNFLANDNADMFAEHRNGTCTELLGQ
jgi:hypothetical protein